nr:MAG TPA: hypothetical protein [Caudoviricetes sp.]
MDVVEFFSDFRRMCKSSSDCTKCQYHGDKCDNAIDLFEKTVAVVEQWSQEHPRKTRQDVFMEQWPNCMMDDGGIIGMCPRNVDKMCVCNLSQSCRCADCRREFWMQEVE